MFFTLMGLSLPTEGHVVSNAPFICCKLIKKNTEKMTLLSFLESSPEDLKFGDQ